MTTVVRDLEIGQPNNSEKCSETAEGVARESEGSAVAARRVPVPAPGRLDQPAVLQKDVELRRLRFCGSGDAEERYLFRTCFSVKLIWPR
jgi:hypothetical protein